MKKIIAAVLGLMLSCSMVFAAEADENKETKETSSSSASSASGKNKITGEVYLSALGFGFNQAVIYDRMLSENLGVGGGVLASESGFSDIGLFGDLKFKKWNFGLGVTFNFNSDAELMGSLYRAVYHGDSWQWGPGKAGFVLGVEGNMFGFESEASEDADLSVILYELPRFVFGVNWQLDF